MFCIVVGRESSTVDRLYSDFSLMIEQIDVTEVSLRNSAEEIFQKSLYVAIGSYFEQRITSYILEFMSKASGDNVLVIEFVRVKGITRQYHTFFSWDRRNANGFFSMFGQEFKDYMVEYVENNPEYRDAIRAFLEIGNVRNEVAHDFGSVNLTKTVNEIYDRYQQALIFIEQMPSRFEEFEQVMRQPPT